MSWLQKVTVGIKFLFGGFESATDYLLGILNGWLTQENIKDNVQKVYRATVGIYALMLKYGDWCPPKWEEPFEKIKATVYELMYTLEDGKIDADEATKVIAPWKAEYKSWMSDDDVIDVQPVEGGG